MDTFVGQGETVRGFVVGNGDLLRVNGSSGLGGGSAFAYDTVVNAGGRLQAYIAELQNTTINAGGEATVGYFRSTVTNVSVSGRLTAGEGTYHNIVVHDGGVLAFSPNPSVLQVYDTVVQSGATILYQGIGGSSHDTQLLAGGRIDLAALPYDGDIRISFAADTSTVTLDGGSGNGTDVYTIDLGGTYDPNGFTLSPDSSGGTILTATPLCFGKGTGIVTPSGEVPVERLRPGDHVLTASGRSRPVRWIGSTSFIVGASNRPVIVRRGALPGGTPHRDLHLTAGHALLLGQLLIPVGELVDGVDIVWDDARVKTVFHVELDVHDVLVANGAAAESFRDDGNRHAFATGQGSGRPPRSTPTCAPVVMRGPVVERTRRRIAEWAEARAERFTAAADQSPTVRGSELVNSSIS